ncbi:hypothetical protein GTQ43_25485 [Nostoc sp. KVJ3]|uniref:hypothetical protein n=1 Tax=Nostoc sp. KVJ3 TaxID=457945 RepID=UPI0022386AA7|nr:hypothetical protein [Nostoc sp. KVJ3]MCW5317049.1 hypothetical protein [Nostoc sp. KVJ3]
MYNLKAIALSLTVFPFKAIASLVSSQVRSHPPKSIVSTRSHLWFHLKCDRLRISAQLKSDRIFWKTHKDAIALYLTDTIDYSKILLFLAF